MSYLFSDPILLTIFIMGVVIAVLVGVIIWLYIKMRRFLVDVDSQHIGQSLDYVSTNLDDLQKFKTDLEKYLTDVERRLRKSVQSVHTVRFNPFKGVGSGGNQSFATAFLNEDGDGVLISSLYSREHVSVFSKPVKKHQSEHELSDEEREALEGAKNVLK